MGLYQLAETLCVPLYELKEKMPTSEYLGWIQYYTQQNEQRQLQEKLGGKKNLLDSPTDLLRGLTL